MVYPRVYGETRKNGSKVTWDYGLSPRVRGNPNAISWHSVVYRSIPACTGKPPPCRTGKFDGQVYPRVYGETAIALPNQPTSYGLSPRVRGNRVVTESVGLDAGSIPACTGKPTRRHGLSGGGPVYPRVYGETLRTFLGLTITGGLSPRVRGNPLQYWVPRQRAGSIPACTGKPP